MEIFTNDFFNGFCFGPFLVTDYRHLGNLYHYYSIRYLNLLLRIYLNKLKEKFVQITYKGPYSKHQPISYFY